MVAYRRNDEIDFRWGFCYTHWSKTRSSVLVMAEHWRDSVKPIIALLMRLDITFNWENIHQIWKFLRLSIVTGLLTYLLTYLRHGTENKQINKLNRLTHGWASECPDVKNYKRRLNSVWHRILYSWTHMVTVGVKGLLAPCTRDDLRNLSTDTNAKRITGIRVLLLLL